MDAATHAPASAPSWAAVSAWGAGLLEIALGAGLMTSPGGAARGAGIVLVIIGAGALGWGVVMLVRGRVIAPRAGIAGALAGLIGAVLALGIDTGRTSVIAVGAASALLVATALACGAELRRRRSSARSGQPRLAVFLVAAVLVAGVVTPALGATEAGRLAPDHSEHGLVVPGHQH